MNIYRNIQKVIVILFFIVIIFLIMHMWDTGNPSSCELCCVQVHFEFVSRENNIVEKHYAMAS